MAADSNMGFHQGVMPSKLQNRHSLFFQSAGSIGGTPPPPPPPMAGSVNMGNSGQVGGSSGGMFFTGGPNGMGSVGGQAGPSSSGASHLGPLDGIRQDSSGLSPEWTIEEQNILKHGLIKYAGEPNSMMKYIKIAAMLHRKTVRDVALRCRWLAENGKRRKLDEYYAGKGMYNRKEKMVDSCSSTNRFILSPGASASYSPMMHQVNQNDLFSCEVPALDGATQQLMDENNQILHQISSNLATYKVQENVDLFCHTRNNITTVLNKMSNMPGIMSQMPPLPVSVNEELLNAILPCPNQAFMFSGPGIHLEQQTRHDDLL